MSGCCTEHAGRLQISRRLQHSLQCMLRAVRILLGREDCLTMVNKLHLQRGGCDNAEEVAAAFRRIVQNGMKGGPIHPVDLLTVRSCGQRVVETFRKKAMEVRCRTLSSSEHNSLQASKKGGLPSRLLSAWVLRQCGACRRATMPSGSWSSRPWPR